MVIIITICIIIFHPEGKRINSLTRFGRGEIWATGCAKFMVYVALIFSTVEIAASVNVCGRALRLLEGDHVAI